MATVDPVQEWNRLTELYRQKSDDELEIIAADAYELTDTARQVLAAEITLRKLDIKVNDEPPPPEDESIGPVHDIDPVEFDLRSIYTARSMEDLAEFKQKLEGAGIAHFIGPEHVQELEDFHGSFERGVRVYVRYVDLQRAMAYLANRPQPSPVNEQASETESEAENTPITCPACQSEEIVFLSHDPKDESKLRWRCDACGNRWTDEAVLW